MLEKRFIESMEYVELHQDNYNTFSNGYALLLQAIGAELDTVFKEFCGFNTSDRKTIADYAQYILTNKPDIINQKNIIARIRYRNTTIPKLECEPTCSDIAVVECFYRY